MSSVRLQDILAKMSGHGWRVTDQRKTLAAIFLNDPSFFSPTEVYERMRTQYPGLSFDTVYRNLRQMAEIGVIEQASMEGTVKFKLHCGAHHHHHHAICIACEKTFSLAYCPMTPAPELPQGFNVLSHRFEVYGHCGDCQESLESSGDRRLPR